MLNIKDKFYSKDAITSIRLCTRIVIEIEAMENEIVNCDFKGIAVHYNVFDNEKDVVRFFSGLDTLRKQ
jgi:hypothetical protein